MKKIVCLITGPPGAGKSTICEKLCEKFSKAVRIDVDYLRHMIRNGYVAPFPKTKESDKQISLATENACILANNFLKSEFNVFIDDVVVSKEKLDTYYKLINNLIVFVLFPKESILVKRDKSRGENAMNERALELHKEFNKIINDRKWHILDSSNHDIEQTLEEIIKIIKK